MPGCCKHNAGRLGCWAYLRVAFNMRQKGVDVGACLLWPREKMQWKNGPGLVQPYYLPRPIPVLYVAHGDGVRGWGTLPTTYPMASSPMTGSPRPPGRHSSNPPRRHRAMAFMFAESYPINDPGPCRSEASTHRMTGSSFAAPSCQFAGRFKAEQRNSYRVGLNFVEYI
jgi:hypothetical protein